MTEKEKYKSSKFITYFVEILGWIFLIGIPLGIWLNDYRWKIIFTSLFAIFIAIILTLVENVKEKKLNEDKKNEK